MYQRDGAISRDDGASQRRDGPLLLPVPEAARLLGIGTTLCWEMVHGGQLPSVRLGRRVLIPRAVVEHLAHVTIDADDADTMTARPLAH